jgi:hypothetical protein
MSVGLAAKPRLKEAGFLSAGWVRTFSGEGEDGTS